MDKFKSESGDKICEVCGNRSTECFEVRLGRDKHVFDSFECAINAMLPRCAHCKCRILGHGVTLGGLLFCSHTCANDGCLRAFEAAVLVREQSHL